MVTLSIGLMVLGFVLIAIAAFWNWFQVLDESYKDREPGRAFYYLLSQLYAIYYEIRHRRNWPHVSLVYGFFLAGCLCFLLAYIVGRKAGALPP